MDIKAEEIHVAIEQVDAVGGARPEPEERPAEHRSLTDVDVATGKIGAGPLDRVGVQSNGATIVQAGTVQEIINAELHRCENCTLWDHVKWKREILPLWTSEAARGNALAQDNLNRLRAIFLMSSSEELITRHASLDDQTMDAEAAMASMGFCHAFSRPPLGSPNDPTITHARTNCPTSGKPTMGLDGKLHEGEIIPLQFKARDPDLEVQIRDRILKMADVNPRTSKAVTTPTPVQKVNTSIDQARLDHFNKHARIVRGAGDVMNNTGSFLQWCSWLMGREDCSQTPGEVSYCLRLFVAKIQDLDPKYGGDELRAGLKNWVVMATWTGLHPELEKTRGWMACDWLARCVLPWWMAKLGYPTSAKTLAAMAEIRDLHTFEIARKTLSDAQQLAYDKTRSLRQTLVETPPAQKEIQTKLLQPMIAVGEQAHALARVAYSNGANEYTAVSCAEAVIVDSMHHGTNSALVLMDRFCSIR